MYFKDVEFEKHLKNEKDDPIAQLYLSYYYKYQGEDQKSIEYLEKSANAGNKVALSRKYYFGCNVQKDRKKSFQILEEELKREK